MTGRPNESTIRQRVWALVEPVCVDAGYELVDVRFVTEQSGWVLRVFIDVPPGGIDVSPDPAVSNPALAAVEVASVIDDVEAAEVISSLPPIVSDGDVDLADCERISREISAVLDVDDPIAVHYSLEVSSPGIDRPLVTEPHFRRYVGAEIKATLHRGVLTDQGSERKNFRGQLVGVEGAGKDAKAKVLVDGQPWLLPIDDVDHARIVPDWDAVMKGGRGQIRAQEGDGAAKHPAKPGAHGRLPHPMAAKAAERMAGKAKPPKKSSSRRGDKPAH